MTASSYASDAKITEALAVLGADLIGQTEQTLLQQLVVAAALGGGGGGGGAATWGTITGTLSAQTDLQAALDAKLNLTGGTLTGLLTCQASGNTALFYCPTATTGETRVTFRAGPANGGVPFNPMIEALNNAGTSIWCVGTLGMHTDKPIYLDTAVSGLGYTRIQANSIFNVNLVSNTTNQCFTNGDGSIDSCVNILGGVLSASTGDGQGSLSSFNSWVPASGSVPFIGIAEQSTLNQTGTATGVSRSFWAKSFLTKTYDHRSFENGSGVTNNLRSSPSATQSNWLANHWTYAAASAETLTDAATVDVTGPPIAGTNVSQTSAYGLRIRTVNVGAGTTTAFGAHITAPTGATTNYAAKFDGKLNFANLPTSSAGLSAGDIYSNAGILTIV